MKPKIRIDQDVLIVEMPESYELVDCWPFFMEELPQSPELKAARAVVIDGSRLQHLGYLGGSAEMLHLCDCVEEGALAMAGFGKSWLNMYRSLAPEHTAKVRYFDTVEAALDSFKLGKNKGRA